MQLQLANRSDRNGLEEIFPFYIRAGGHLFSAFAGFILLTLAANLLRRQRLSWLLPVTLLILSIISHLLKELDYEESLLAGVLLTQLLVMRNTFTAQSDRPSIVKWHRNYCSLYFLTLRSGAPAAVLYRVRWHRLRLASR